MDYSSIVFRADALCGVIMQPHMLLTPRILDFNGGQIYQAFSYDSRYLVTTTDSPIYTSPINSDEPYVPLCGGVVWEVESGEILTRFAERYVYGVAASPNDHTFLSGVDFALRTLVLRDFHTGQTLRTFPSPNDPPYIFGSPFAFSSDGNWLAVFRNRDGIVTILPLSIPTGYRHISCPRDERILIHLRFLPGNRYLAGKGATYDQTDRLYLWDALHNPRPLVFKHRSCDNVLLSHQGAILASVHPPAEEKPKRLMFWRLTLAPDGTPSGWEKIGSSISHGWYLWDGQFTPDDSLLVTMGSEHMDWDGISQYALHIWDIKTFTKKEIQIHGVCYCMGISPDGRLLAAMTAVAAHDGTDVPSFRLTIWNLPDGTELTSAITPCPAEKAGEKPRSMTFSPDGRWLSVAHFGHIEVWNVACLTCPTQAPLDP